MEEKKTRTEKDVRTNDILLGFLERPALAFFARHMPMWINSDILTAIGTLGAVLTGLGYFFAGQTGDLKGNGFLFLASLGLIIHWWGDSLDGTLARYRHQERPNYGYYTDHALDGLSSLVIFLGLGLSGVADFSVVMFTLACWLLLMIQVYLKTHATGTFEMTSVWIGPTEIRLMGIIINTVLFFTGSGPVYLTVKLLQLTIEFNIGTIVLAVLGVAMLIYYFVQVGTTGYKLSVEDYEALKEKNAERARQGILSPMEIDRRAAEKKKENKKKTKTLLDYFTKTE